MSEEPVQQVQDQKEVSLLMKFQPILNAVGHDQPDAMQNLKKFFATIDPAAKIDLLKETVKVKNMHLRMHLSLFELMTYHYGVKNEEMLHAALEGAKDEQIYEFLLQEITYSSKNFARILVIMLKLDEGQSLLTAGIEKALFKEISSIELRGKLLIEIIRQLEPLIDMPSFNQTQVGKYVVGLLEGTYDKLSPRSKQDILSALIRYFNQGLNFWSQPTVKKEALCDFYGSSESVQSLVCLQIEAILMAVDQREKFSSSSGKPDAERERRILTTPLKDFVADDSLLAALEGHSSITALLKFPISMLERRFLALDPEERYTLLRHAASQLPKIGPRGFGEILGYLESIWHKLSQRSDKIDIAHLLRKFNRDVMPQEQGGILKYLSFFFAIQAEAALLAAENGESSPSLFYQWANEMAKKSWDTYPSDIVALKIIYQTHCVMADRYQALVGSLPPERFVIPAEEGDARMAVYNAYNVFAKAAARDDYRTCYRQQQFLVQYYCHELLSLKAIGEPAATEGSANIDINLSDFDGLDRVLTGFKNLSSTNVAANNAMAEFPNVWKNLPKDSALKYKILLTSKGRDAIFFFVKKDAQLLLKTVLEDLGDSEQIFKIIATPTKGKYSPFSLGMLYNRKEILEMIREKLAPADQIKLNQLINKTLAIEGFMAKYQGSDRGLDCQHIYKVFLEECTLRPSLIKSPWRADEQKREAPASSSHAAMSWEHLASQAPSLTGSTAASVVGALRKADEKREVSASSDPDDAMDWEHLESQTTVGGVSQTASSSGALSVTKGMAKFSITSQRGGAASGSSDGPGAVSSSSPPASGLQGTRR